MKSLQKYKLAWEDFYKSLSNEIAESCTEEFEDMPFEMQLGVYLKYLEDNELSILMESVGDWIIYDHIQDIPLDIDYRPVPVFGVTNRLDYYKQAIEYGFEVMNNRLWKGTDVRI